MNPYQYCCDIKGGKAGTVKLMLPDMMKYFPHIPCGFPQWLNDENAVSSKQPERIKRYRTMKLILYLGLLCILFVLLVSCGNQPTASPTGLPIPTAISPTSLPASTFIPVTVIPSSLPTQSLIFYITPDPIQVERWKEYEEALAKSILPTFSSEFILCEWDILAQASQDVYVWAVCASPNVSDWRPAVIHLGADGSVRSVEIPKRGSSSDIDRMFPEEAQMKFSLYTGNSLFDGRLKEMLNHLDYRETHPEELPLIVLLAPPTP